MPSSIIKSIPPVLPSSNTIGGWNRGFLEQNLQPWHIEDHNVLCGATAPSTPKEKRALEMCQAAAAELYEFLTRPDFRSTIPDLVHKPWMRHVVVSKTKSTRCLSLRTPANIQTDEDAQRWVLKKFAGRHNTTLFKKLRRLAHVYLGWSA